MRTLFLSAFLIFWYGCFGQLSGKVVSISDGDTFWIVTEKNERIKVRLYGIDCPERGQAFGGVAKKYLSDLLFGKTVSVNKKNVDRYGRTIGLVTVGTVVVNESLLKAGLAWHYKQYDKNSRWAAMEAKARKDKIGLWIEPNAVAPWDYRKTKKRKQELPNKP